MVGAGRAVRRRPTPWGSASTSGRCLRRAARRRRGATDDRGAARARDGADRERGHRRHDPAGFLPLPEALPARAPARRARRSRLVPFARGTAERDGAALDARSEGTLLHRVLETVPREAFGAAAPLEEVTRALAAAGLEPGATGHATIVARAERFLRGAYAREIAEQGRPARARAAVRAVGGGRRPNGVPTWDHRSARPLARRRARRHRLQARTRPLGRAARAPALGLRAGRAGALPRVARARGHRVPGRERPIRPQFATLPRPAKVRSRLVELVAALVRARQSERFVRVPVAQCKAIHCGYVGLLSPARRTGAARALRRLSGAKKPSSSSERYRSPATMR